MIKQIPIDAIYQVMNALRYSLASYLRFAHPWIDAAAQFIAEKIERVAEDHHRHANRIGELLVDRHGHVASRTFPRTYAALNGLSVEYLLPSVIEDEKQIIHIVEAASASLERDAEAFALLAEILASEKRHLQILERLPARRGAIGIARSIRPRQQGSKWPTGIGSLRLRTPSVRRAVKN
jgi:bacterioferritin (cytochrome b1)